MSHADRIWPALATLRRGELPCPAEIDALVALARGEAQAPKAPRLIPDGDESDALVRQWGEAYEAEFLCSAPKLAPAARAALRGAERDMAGSARFYAWFFRWIQSAGRDRSPEWASSITPEPAKFRQRLPVVAAWAGPRIAAAERAAKERAEVERAGQRPCDCERAGQASEPPGGFAALRSRLANAKTWKGGAE